MNSSFSQSIHASLEIVEFRNLSPQIKLSLPTSSPGGIKVEQVQFGSLAAVPSMTKNTGLHNGSSIQQIVSG